MESYEDFCARVLSKLQSEMIHQMNCSPLPVKRGADSFICFRGRAVLSPVLNEEQITEMDEYKKRAMHLEAKRRMHHKNNLLNQIQTNSWTSKEPKTFDVPETVKQPTSSTKTAHRNECTMHDTAKRTPGGGTEPFILTSTPLAESSGVIEAKAGEKKQIEEEIKSEEVSLQHLLKKSREFIEKEQGRQGSKVIISKKADPFVMPSENPSDKENGSSLPFYTPCSLPPSQSSHSPLISPEPGVSLRPHRIRPRPISACSIFFTYPDNTNQPSITANGRSPDVLTPSQERRTLGVENVSSNRFDNHSRFNTSTETMNTKGGLKTSPVDPELTSPLFRRRCHTMDSQPSSRPLIDRSQERMPRFMAGVTSKTPPRLSPTSPMRKTFTRETPISPSYGKLASEMEGNSVIGTALMERRTDEMQWQIHATEMQKPLEEDYAFRMSCLAAEQKREQLRLIHVSVFESEERGRMLRGQGVLSPVADGDGCELRAAGECYPVVSPICSLSPGDGSSHHPLSCIGFPSSMLDIQSPSIQTPIYIRGLNHSTGKNRNRLSQVITAEQQRALCHLCAIVKGFLTRRLLTTEKVKHLRQTVQDTQEFIRSFSANQMSEQDFCLQERVRAQLRAALFDIHDIFFTMTLEERLSLLQQDRDLRTERKLREMEKAKSPKDKMILSAATQKSLDRKKQRMGESPGQTRKVQKTKSPPTKRILQPSQGQNAPVSGQQLPRRGSYKKSPEERVQHSERLKKQHSLG
ncbi:uncharacterized protein [Paramisgurnus dabryanus]|uniref:uncharacterized protein isoform X1 n=1 Tax=Paramisgurnus dabryanus TaxID=90735 RepID=UPI003CCFA415